MDDVPDSSSPEIAPAPTTDEPDDGPDEQGYRKTARKQTFEDKQYSVSDLNAKLNARKNGPSPATSCHLVRCRAKLDNLESSVCKNTFQLGSAARAVCNLYQSERHYREDTPANSG